MNKQRNFKVLIAFFFLSLSCLTNVYAQEQKVTVNLKNVSLKDVFKEIEKQTTYRFSYRNNLLDNRKDITTSKVNVDVSAVLNDILKGRDLEYKIVSSKMIAISQKRKDAMPKGKTQKVSGVVRDKDGEPIIGANVRVMNTSIGTITDVDGNFSLDVPDDGKLGITYIGYNDQILAIEDKKSFKIILEEDNKVLDEVVVIGYGTVKKSDLTGAVANLSADESNKGGVSTSVGQMLQGHVAGLISQQGSPQPGGSTDVVIRGRNSIYGSSAPLYIVDGFPFNPSSAPDAGSVGFSSSGSRDPLNFINPNDIENISVLKDAAATAIYGTRGANGVIIITTKRGLLGRLKVNYDGYAGLQTQAKKYDMMSGPEYMNYWNNQEGGPKFTQEQINNAKTTNWVDQVTRQGFVQSHQINLSAAGNDLRYYFSAGYYDQDGILKSSAMSRYTARSNVEYKKDKLKINTNISYANIKDQNQPDAGGSRNSMLESALSFAPYLEPSADGSYVADPGSAFKVYPNSLLNISDISKSDRTDINANIEYEIIKGLKPQLKVGYNVQNVTRTFFLPSTTPLNGGLPDSDGRFHKGRASVTGNRNEDITLEGLLNYNQTFKNSLNLSALAGYSYLSRKWNGNRAKGEGFSPIDVFGSNNIGAADKQYADSWKGDNAIISGFGRLDLSCKDKYFVTGTVRRDGASNFGENNKWGWFPGASAAWKISNEDFMKKYTYINQLKLRIGWGMTGNSGFGNYLSQSLYYVSNSGGAIIGQQQLTATRLADTKANPDLKWEKTSQFNAGIDLALFNILDISLDFYKKKTTDLIIPMKLPTESGLNQQWVNAADFDVKGFESTISATIVNDKDINWTTNFNLGWSDNKVSKINLSGDAAISSLQDIGIIVGEKPNSYFMYKFKSINEDGAMTFYDLNNDGSVDSKDRMVMGSSDPNVTLGLGNSISYKGITLDLFFDAALGRKLHNWHKADHSSAYLADPSNLYRCTLTEKDLPKYYLQAVGGSFTNNDRWLEDGSYCRLQNVTLSYNFPKTAFGNIVDNIKVYVQGQNLLTFSKWSGVNPESNGLYPSLRSFTGGLSVTF